MNLIHFLNYINLARFADNVSDSGNTVAQTKQMKRLNKLFNNDGAGKIRGLTDNTNKTTW